MISAQIIADSKSSISGDRITTFVLTFPRIVLAEFNTHRMLSRNSASSRAIPAHVMIKNLNENAFKPIQWLKEHKGMQGFEEWEAGSPEAIEAERLWYAARDAAIKYSEALAELKISKQFSNRLLEPFMWHTIVATGTEWENFIALRAHNMAEIHIQNLAFKMLHELNTSEPKLLVPGAWHIPFEDKIPEDFDIDDKLKISAGLCAGISYGKIKDVPDHETGLDLIDLHDSLVIRPYSGKRGIRNIDDPIHASPVEHQARCMRAFEFDDYVSGFKGNNKDDSFSEFGSEALGWSGNFKGFIQYRKMLQNENATDKRIIK